MHVENEGLDSFLYEQTGERREDAEWLQTTKKTLTVFHGKSSVEQGFSEKSDIVDTNMNEETLIYCIDKHKMVLRTSTNL